jgi:hypothetical protein
VTSSASGQARRSRSASWRSCTGYLRRRTRLTGGPTSLQIIARSSRRSFSELLERELNTRLQLRPDASSPPVLSPQQSSSPDEAAEAGTVPGGAAGAVAEDRGGDRARGEPQRGGVPGAVRRGGQLLRASVRLPGAAGAGRGDPRGGGAERKERHDERLAHAVGAPDGARRAQLRRDDGWRPGSCCRAAGGPGTRSRTTRAATGSSSAGTEGRSTPSPCAGSAP